MIYYVEDDDNIRELVVYTLTQMSLPCKGFADGSAFRKALEEAVPDLVLLDIMLPGEDGMSLLRFLRENHRTAETPVIMLTAKGTATNLYGGIVFKGFPLKYASSHLAVSSKIGEEDSYMLFAE